LQNNPWNVSGSPTSHVEKVGAAIQLETGETTMIRLPKFFVGVLALALLLSLTMPVLADEAKGTIRTANATSRELVLKGTFKDTTYVLTPDAAVFLDGKKAAIADLREGDRAVLAFAKEKDTLRAREVRCLRKAAETTGKVHSVLAENKDIVLKGVVSNTTYHLQKDSSIFINGKQSKFSELRPEDQVRITYERQGDQLMAIEVAATRK
jgi:hypothetical protein